MEIRTDEALHNTLKDAFPGSRLDVEDRNGRFELQLQQHGLLRPLSAAELSDGTLRFLLLDRSPAYTTSTRVDGSERAGNQPAPGLAACACETDSGRSPTHADNRGFSCSNIDFGLGC